MTLCDNVHIYHSNSQLTSWVGRNGPVYVGKEDKQVKQHSYVTSSQKLYLQYINTSQTLSCQNERKMCLHTWTTCDRVSYRFLHVCLSMILYDNVHMYHSNSQLTTWVGGNGTVHVEKKDKEVKQHSYVTSLQKLSKTVMSKWREKVSTYMDSMRPSLLLIYVCLPISYIVWQCVHISF